jgi:hypothetical protein
MTIEANIATISIADIYNYRVVATTVITDNPRFTVSCTKVLREKYNCTVVLYGCQTWSLALREEHGPRVFENGC